jgi:protein arginine N-methyltransferase 1
MRDQTAIYSDVYNNPSNQKIMLLDFHRTDSYKRAIEQIIKPGQIVVDVGAGAGILSLFSASSGADKVYAIEATYIIETAKKLAKLNKLDDKIEFINDLAQNVSLDTKVDVLVSEWMGFFVMEEYMFDAVQIVCEKFLSAGGIKSV